MREITSSPSQPHTLESPTHAKSRMNQPKLLDHYPWLIPWLYLAVTGEIIMTLSRLFETKKDQPSLL